MLAAVVHRFDAPPTCESIDAPVATGDHAVVVEVLAAGLHPRVRSQASGSHYTSTDQLPLVPGVDGVGRRPDGKLVYFVLDDTTKGSMAEQTVIDERRSVVLPDGIDPVTVAAVMNPAMSSWVALRRRIEFQQGQSVLVLGATGNAGRLAVRVARRLGAGQVVAAARDTSRLESLAEGGADVLVALDDREGLQRATADIDVVLDYVWGPPAVEVMTALARGRTDAAKPLAWIQIGSVAGAEAAIPSAALRSTNLRVMGSGQGSVPTRVIVDELSALAAEVASGALSAETTAVPLSDVESAWLTPTRTRVVIVPG